MEFLANLTPLISLVGWIAIIITARVYLKSVGKKEEERISDEKIKETFDRQAGLIATLEKQVNELEKQLAKQRSESEQDKLRVKYLEGEVERWKDVATNKTAINEVKESIKFFQDRMPEQEKMADEFRVIIQGIQTHLLELRGMIRDDRKMTEASVKVLDDIVTTLKENSSIIRTLAREVDTMMTERKKG